MREMAADTVQQIKEKLSIVDVVGAYVKLTKAGRYYKGLSPFNKEKTPSFYVNPERNSYYCFSSSQGGDMFTFIEKMEGVDFKGAMKILADKAGVEIVFTKNPNKGKEDRAREAVARAEAYFARNLSEESSAYAYALSRGLTAETIRTWNLGFAPDAWRGLLEELSAQGFTTEELLSAGLIKEADGKPGTYYDRFRNRLMFPIADAAGRTVAFTGRALSPDDQAKYLNSPETDLFKKSQVLFGMHRAKDAIRTRGFAMLVEGQFDLILLHQIGFTNTIALSGTALSRDHLSYIKRYADNLMLALDADRAGLAASAKNALAALAASMRVKAVRLPQGKDPADLAKEDAQEFTKLVSQSEPIVEFFLSVLAASEKDQHRLVVAAERIVLPLISSMKSPMEREHFAGIVARSLGISPESVKSALPKYTQVEEPSEGPVKPDVKSSSFIDSRSELIRAVISTYEGTPLAKRLQNEYARIIGTPPGDDPIPERVLFEAGLLFGEQPTEEAGNDLVRALERACLTKELDDATRQLRVAESSKDSKAIEAAMAACKAVSARISSLG